MADWAVVLVDLTYHGGLTNSQDQAALLRFVEIVAPDDLDAQQYLDPRFEGSIHQPPGVRERMRAASVRVQGYQERRRRALTQIVKKGLAESGWEGTGERGMNRFGSTRFRWYRLRPQPGATP